MERKFRGENAVQCSPLLLALALLPPPGETLDGPETLGEVVVQAQKRPAELQRVPLPVSVLTATDIEAMGIQSLEDVALHSPMLDLQESVTAATTTLRIRRVGNLGNIPTFEPAVGLFVDGAFRSRSLFAGGALLDVERIEVLRGPQTSLYGKNVSGGVVAVHTRQPAPRFEAMAEVSTGYLEAPGSPLLARVRGLAGGPLAGNWRGSLAAGGAWQDPAAQNPLEPALDGNGLAEVGARGQLQWSPDDRLDLRLTGAYFGRDDREGESDVIFVPGAPSTLLLESLQEQGLTGSCASNRPHDRRSCSVATNRLDLDAAEATLIADYRLANGWQLHSITGYERYRDRRDEDDAVQLLAPLLFFHDSEESEAWQEELRLASTDEARMPWLGGIFFYSSDYRRGAGGDRPMFGANGTLAFDPFWDSALGLPLALPGQQGLHDSRLRTEYVAGFGEVALPLLARLELTAGARWAQEEKRASIRNTVTAPGASVISRVLTPETSPGGEPVNGRARRASDDVTWHLTPALRVGQGQLLYATWARGGKFGGFNTGFGNAPLSAREIGDESIDHLEAGGRFRFAGGRGRASASAFSTRYHDFQDAAFIAAQFAVGNVARLDVDGLELEAEYQFESGTHASLGLSYADVAYGRNTTGMCAPGRVPDGTLPGACDLTGERPVNAPPWSAHLGVEQGWTWAGAETYLRLDWTWTDRYNTSFSADPRLVQPDYHDLALRFAIGLGPSFDLVLAGENLLDETIVHFDSVLNFFNDASYQSYLGPSRRYSLTLRARL
jgi:outer membrane receptor protein involved in Fe transport